MDFHAGLARFAPAPRLAQWVSAMFSQTCKTLATCRTGLKAAQVKTQALALEFARHRHIRFVSALR